MNDEIGEVPIPGFISMLTFRDLGWLRAVNARLWRSPT